MGDNGFVRIGARHQLLDHPVRADRRLIGIQQRLPLRHPLRSDRGDFAHHVAVVAVGLDGLAQLADQRLQGQLGIADQADGADDILVQVVRVQRGMNELLALGELDPEIRFRERTPDADDQIGILHEVVHGLRHRVATGPQRQRMVFRERAFPAQAGGHRRAQQFGEFPQLRPGFRPLHAGAGVDHRPLRRQDRCRGLAHVGRIGTVLADAHGGVVEFADILIPDIGRDFDDRGATAAVAQVAEGAPHDVADFAGQVHHLGAFRHVPHFARRSEIRVDLRDAARIALRQHQQRHGFRIGLGDAAIGVLRARSVLHAEGADLAARGHAGDRIGHVQPDPLLPDDDRADVGRRGVFQQMVDGVAAEDLDPLALHDLRNRVADLH